MVSRAHTVAFWGVEARPVTVECAVTPGLPAFTLVGLPDKAVSESKERVRAALTVIGLALPAQRVTINLSPADMPKAGSHFDLAIALALMTALEVIPAEETGAHVALGELSLDGMIGPVAGALPAALTAAAAGRGLICPAPTGRRRPGSAPARSWRRTACSPWSTISPGAVRSPRPRRARSRSATAPPI